MWLIWSYMLMDGRQGGGVNWKEGTLQKVENVVPLPKHDYMRTGAT